MALVMPYPNTPLNGQSGDATPINANFTALAQAIQSFDGSQIAAATVVASALSSTINPITRDNLILRNFISSGCIWSSVSGLTGTMSSGVLFINGNMVTVNGVVSNTFTASQDTYIDIDYNGNVYYQGVSNNAASPSLTANSVRVAIVITNGSTITFVNQGQTDTTLSNFGPTISSVILTLTDSLGNIIYPTDPSSRIIGYRQVTTSQGSITTETDLTGLSSSVIVPTNRHIEIIAMGSMESSVIADDVYLIIKEGSTRLRGSNVTISTANRSFGIMTSVVLFPTAGLHTYKLSAIRQNGSGNAQLDADSGTTRGPAFIEIRLV